MEIVTNALKDTLRINRIILWTDSSIVLSWIQSERTSDTWKTFVANRIEEIREITRKHSWRHIDGEENPADLISRGRSVNKIINCKQWWTGPTWITKPEIKWPTQKISIIQDDVTEQRKEIIILQLQTENKNDFFNIINTFSKLERLQRVTSYMFRAITLSKNRLKDELKAE